MEYKHSCVIDAKGCYKTIVLQFLERLPSEDGEVWRVQYYAMEKGETLVDTQQPSLRPHAGATGFVRPRWNSTAWEEGATAEEIASWMLEHPAPEPPPPMPLDKLKEENRVLSAKVTALSEQNDFQEELIVELAGVIYA